MLHNDSFIWYLVAFIVIGGIVALANLFGSEARIRRRRRKSHSRIVSKSRQPTVKFSVKTPKEE
jgi:hypothetical protein